MSGMRELEGVDNSTSKRVLDMLKSVSCSIL